MNDYTHCLLCGKPLMISVDGTLAFCGDCNGTRMYPVNGMFSKLQRKEIKRRKARLEFPIATRLKIAMQSGRRGGNGIYTLSDRQGLWCCGWKSDESVGARMGGGTIHLVRYEAAEAAVAEAAKKLEKT